MFNVCFILPLLAVIATLTLAGDDAQRVLRSIRDKLQANWPKLLAIVGVLAGVFVTFLGVTGLASMGHGHIGRLARHLRVFLRP